MNIKQVADTLMTFFSSLHMLLWLEHHHCRVRSWDRPSPHCWPSTICTPYISSVDISSPWAHLEMTEETTELPVSDLSPWSNQIRMAVILSQQFFPNLKKNFVSPKIHSLRCQEPVLKVFISKTFCLRCEIGREGLIIENYFILLYMFFTDFTECNNIVVSAKMFRVISVTGVPKGLLGFK